MPILTKQELNIITGKIPSTFKERNPILLKLDNFQKQITSSEHIKKVNSYIYQASTDASSKAREMGFQENTPGREALISKLFLRRMNELTKQAGLRT